MEENSFDNESFLGKFDSDRLLEKASKVKAILICCLIITSVATVLAIIKMNEYKDELEKLKKANQA